MYDKSGMGEVILDYFKDLFSFACTNQFDVILDKIPKSFNKDIRLSLDKPVSNKEILDAFSQMDPRKAPGMDGLLGTFYKENGDVVGRDVLRLCHEILNGERQVNIINETIINLILKSRIWMI